jgi:hypothetical protein
MTDRDHPQKPRTTLQPIGHPQDDEGMRLLPWAGPEGKPCYLSTDRPDSLMSRIADDIEAAQVRRGAEVVREAQAVLGDPVAGALSLRLELQRTTESLTDVLRVADARGRRLRPVGTGPDADDDGGVSGECDAGDSGGERQDGS